MARRGKKEGSIYKRENGFWRAQISIDGKRLSHTGKSRSECNEWLRKTMDLVDKGMTFQSRNLSTKEYLVDWFSIKKNTIKQKKPTEEGRPFFLFNEFNLEIFFTSINENLNGISTTNLKRSLFDIKSKIDLCNRYTLDNSMSNRFGRTLNALLDLDKYIKKSINELHKFKFVKKFKDLKKTQGYNTLKMRHFN